MRTDLLKHMQVVARVSPLGLYAGTMMKVDIDMNRIHAVAERIVRVSSITMWRGQCQLIALSVPCASRGK